MSPKNNASLPPMESDTDGSFRNKMIAASIGSVFEWYDFAIFGAFADVIGDEFFGGSGSKALLQSLGVFGAAFLMRPIGGIAMGYIGDTSGRKRALEISILLMLLPSFLMGCLPTHSDIGGWAIFLLILLRLIQGLAVGGELVSAYVFCIESAPAGTKVFWGAMTLDACNVGTMLGISVAAITRASLTNDQLHRYGWRIGFWVGILVAIAGVVLRQGMEDTAEFKKMQAEKAASPGQAENPLRVACREHFWPIVYVAGTAAIWCTGFYTYFVWMPFLMGDALEVDGANAISGYMAISTVSLAFMILAFVPIAWTASSFL